MLVTTIVSTALLYRSILRNDLHIVVVALHQTILVVKRILCFLLSTSRVYVGDTQSHAKAQRIGKAEPLVPVAMIADIVGGITYLSSIAWLDAVYSLLQHTEHRIVNLSLGVVSHIVGLRNLGLHILLERHIAISISVGKRQESIVDTCGIEQVLILLGVFVELIGTQQGTILAAAVVVEMSPTSTAPSILIIIVRRLTCMLRLVVSHEARIDIMTQVGSDLIVVEESFIEEVAENGVGRAQLALQRQGISLAHLVVDVDVGILGIVILTRLLFTAASGIIRQFVWILAHIVHVVARSQTC